MFEIERHWNKTRYVLLRRVIFLSLFCARKVKHFKDWNFEDAKNDKAHTSKTRLKRVQRPQLFNNRLILLFFGHVRTDGCKNSLSILSHGNVTCIFPKFQGWNGRKTMIYVAFFSDPTFCNSFRSRVLTTYLKKYIHVMHTARKIDVHSI